MLIRRLFATCLWGACVCGPQTGRGGDWPQILGPDRNGKAQNEQLLSAWPAGVPQLLWSREVGQGFAGVAVAGDRAILFHRLGNDLVAECLQVANGNKIWSARTVTRYASTISEDAGPRCVPLIADNRIFLLGPDGELSCVALDSGEQLWSRNLAKDFRAAEGYFGFGSSPIVSGDKLVLNVGGTPGAGLVALDLKSGQTVWQATDEGASYSSPVATSIAGQSCLLFVTRYNVVSVDPSTGKVFFRFPFGARGPTVNAASPLVLDGHVFVSASYGVGAQWAQLGATSATKVWENDDVMSSQFATSIEKDGTLYGIDGRQDVGVARLRAFDPRTGKVHWTKEGFGAGTLLLADGKLLIMKTSGELVLVDPSPQAYRQLASARLFNTTTQALPALANGRLLVRDTKTLKCVQVGTIGETH